MSLEPGSKTPQISPLEIRGEAMILTQGGLTSEYGNIQCIIKSKISMGGRI